MSSVRDIENPFTTLNLVILIIACFLFGGSPNLPSVAFTIIALLSVTMLSLVINNGVLSKLAALGFWTKLSFCLVLLLPLIQLVPLPPFIWHLLPGRELFNETRSIVGYGQIWYPISLDQYSTAFTFFALFPGTASFLGWLTLEDEERKLIIFAIIFMAALSIMVGLIQFASGGAYLDIYDNSHRGYFQGFFANRNHAALMLCCIVVIVVFVRRLVRVRQQHELFVWFVTAILALLCGLSILTTLSRAGLGLLVAAIAMILLSDQIIRLRGRWVLAAVFLGIPLSFVVILQLGVVADLFDRFGTVAEDDRLRIWRTTLEMARDYFPIGSGLGTFRPIFAKYETVSELMPTYVNHAHQDFLEFFLETGALGIVFLAVIIIAISLALIQLWRSRSKSIGPYPYIGAMIVVLTLLHSMVDYPLRTQTMAVLFGLAAAMLAETGRLAGKTRQSNQQNKPQGG